MKHQNTRQKLIDLGVETLADALLKFASQSEEAANLIAHLVATPKENVKRFKAKISGLKRGKRFIDWRESRHFAQSLETMLADLQAGVSDPPQGIELLAAFFRCDEAIFESCDDSGGSVGVVFGDTARSLFVDYARQCNDKDWLVDQLRDLFAADNYGVRGCLIDCAGEYLSETAMRKLAMQFQVEAEKYPNGSWEKRHYLRGVEILAKQLKDAELFEQTRLRSSPETSVAACLDIAKVYLSARNPQKALDWLEKISDKETFRINDKNLLLLAIYKKLRNPEKMAETAWRIFHGNRSEENFAQLLSIIGKDQRDTVIREECARIMRVKDFSDIDAGFLIREGLADEAEKYVLARREQLNGDFYGSLLPLAQSLEMEKRYLSACLIYRALLESILRRAQSKYYHHGVRYLKKLDQLAREIAEWQDLTPHRQFFEAILATHQRKRSFWAKYNQ